MIAYQGSGFYAILIVDKVLKVYHYQTWGPEEESKLGTPFVVNNEQEFWDCVVYVIEEKFS